MIELIRNKKIFVIAAVLLWFKTMIVGLVDFKITIENPIQFIIHLINPIAIIMLVLGFIFMRKASRQYIYLFLFITVFSIILYANGVYYREFTDYITLPLLLVGNNVADLTSSIIALVHWTDVIYFIDIAIVAFLYKVEKRKGKTIGSQVKFRQLKPYFIMVILIGILNLSLANIERPQLLTRSFDRELLVKNLGIYNFHLYDAYLHASTSAHRVFASEDELDEINDYIGKNTEEETDRDLFGVAKGKNVIMIAAESVQNFVINNTVNGQEITPFLNELIEDSFYFEEFYHQTAQGKSSDSEFLIENSLYPLPRGAVFFTHAQNQYYALPHIMKKHGYFTAALHANNGSFWNRNMMYESLGYDRFYTEDDYVITEENSIGWGLKDIDFMEQSIEHLLEMEQPFHVKLITLTNHFPFDLDEEDHFIEPYHSNSNTLNKYFPTVRYTDEAIRVFFDLLKETGLYEDSIIVIYGDHYGISTNHNKAMSMYLDKEVTPYVEMELQQVPLIIHIPGVEGETISTIGGQIDLRPTLLYLLGIEEENQTIFGSNLFSKDHEELVIMRDGSFVTRDVIYKNDICYLRDTEEPIEGELREVLCEVHFDEVQQELDYSDRIIYGDLLRFDEDIMAEIEEIEGARQEEDEEEYGQDDKLLNDESDDDRLDSESIHTENNSKEETLETDNFAPAR